MQTRKIDRDSARKMIDEILSGKIKTKAELTKAKRRLAKEKGLEGVIADSAILEHAGKSERENLTILVKKPVRTISGVAIVAVMTRPASCPGECIYCPQGENAPKSYTGLEPAARRAAMFDFDPCLQTENRLSQLEAIGHSTEKVELIIMGGTFPSTPKEYQETFVKRCLDALNGFEAESLEAAKKANENAKRRCVGLTIETRPDFCKKEHIDMMLTLGATRVELGVQTLSDEVYRKVRRGHTIADVIQATQLLKDSAFKIVYHMMPGLLQSPEEDIRMIEELFDNPDFRPDMLKIYPTLVVSGTKLYDMWKCGEYEPLTNEQAAEIVAKAESILPEYCRTMRIQRDIPATEIECGVTASNLRELAEDYAREQNLDMNSIRYREAGHRLYKDGKLPEDCELCVLEYDASEGREFFISFEDKKNEILLGYVRVRVPNEPFREEIDKKTALVRELKVFGTALALGEHNNDSFQHKGLGKKLMLEAERIAKECDMERIVVISAIGTREYYRKIGYCDCGAYVSKSIH